MTKLTWLGHSSWLLETNSHRVLIDPFFTDNPAATSRASDFDSISHILITHGHFDHVADVAEIAKANDSTLVAMFEICQWFSKHHGITDGMGMNLGGQTSLPFGSLKMVPALHSSSLPDGSYAGSAAGLMLSIDGKRIYFAGDTALFSDMKLYAHGVDVAVLPIGDLFTMGIDDSVEATKLIDPKSVLPTHYGTWPPIEQDAGLWSDKISNETNATPVVLAVGESHEI